MTRTASLTSAEVISLLLCVACIVPSRLSISSHFESSSNHETCLQSITVIAPSRTACVQKGEFMFLLKGWLGSVLALTDAHKHIPRRGSSGALLRSNILVLFFAFTLTTFVNESVLSDMNGNDIRAGVFMALAMLVYLAMC